MPRSHLELIPGVSAERGYSHGFGGCHILFHQEQAMSLRKSFRQWMSSRRNLERFGNNRPFMSTRLAIEELEDRTVLSTATDFLAKLDAFAPNAASLGGTIASSPNASQLSAGLPVVKDTLKDALNLDGLFRTLFNQIAVTIDSGKLNNDTEAMMTIAKLNNRDIPGLKVTRDPLTPGETVLELQYTIAPATFNFSPATTASDFGLSGTTAYLKDLAGLKFVGMVAANFNGAQFVLTFGVANSASPKFYLGEGDLFKNASSSSIPALTATATLDAGVTTKVLDLPYTATLQGSVNVSTTFQVNLDSPSGTRLVEGEELDRLTQHTSALVNGAVDFTGKVEVQVLGLSLVNWDVAISWIITSGMVSTPTLANMGVKVQNATFLTTSAGGDPRELIKSALVSNALPDDLFGLDRYGVNLDVIGDVLKTASQFADLLSPLNGKLGQEGLTNPLLNPTQTAQFAKNNPVLTSIADPADTASSGFRFADPATLERFARGENVDLVTYQVGETPLANVEFTVDYPIASQVFIIVQVKESAALRLTFTPSFRLRLGLDGQGLFVDRTATGFKVTLAAEALVKVEAGIVGFEAAEYIRLNLKIAELALGFLGTLSADLQLAGTQTKVYANNLASGIDLSSVINLGKWLKDNTELHTLVTGDVYVHLRVNTPSNVAADFLPDWARSELEDLLTANGIRPDQIIGRIGTILGAACDIPIVSDAVDGVSQVPSKIGKAFEDITDGDPSSLDPTTNGLLPKFGLLEDEKCQNAADDIAQLTTQDYIPVFDSLAMALKINPPEPMNAPPLTAPPTIAPLSSLIPGIVHKQFLGTTAQGQYTWKFPVSRKVNVIKSELGGLNQGSVSNLAPGSSDVIQYQLIRTDGGHEPPLSFTLKITGTADHNTVHINQMGSGIIELVRTTRLPDGTVLTDPLRKFEKVTAIIVDLGNGTDAFLMSPDLTIPTSVMGGNGNDTIVTGSGNDVIDGGTGFNDINSGAGDDDIRVFGPSVIQAGSGRDIIHGSDGSDTLSGDEGNDVVLGGAGDDELNGGDGDDQLDGGNGLDTVEGGAGNDVLSGGEGNDLLSGGSGTDTILGGADSDTILWGEGDGNDVLDGGTGPDALFVITSDDADQLFLSRFGVGATLVRTGTSPFSLRLDALEHLFLLTGEGADSVSIGDLSGSGVQFVGLSFFEESPQTDTITVTGTSLNDSIAITATNGLVTLNGLAARSRIQSAGSQNDQLRVLGTDGNDSITARPGVEDTIQITLNGGSGDDFLSADAILIGGTGDDFLEGGAGDDQLFGNAGNDIMIGGGGNDTFDGGADFDTILIRGTPGNDIINVNQTSSTNLQHAVNGNTENDTLVTSGGVRTVEAVRVEADLGSDLIQASWADSLGIDVSTNSLRIDVLGGADFTQDRLSVVDGGTGDLVLYRKGDVDSTGTVLLGPANLEPLQLTFEGIEVFQPVESTGGSTVVFRHDEFEINNERANAADLGAPLSLTLIGSIDPGPSPTFGLAGDQDWFKVEAQVTGTLDLQLFFRHIEKVSSNRPGLPGKGNLTLTVFDATGDAISSGQSASTDDNERVRIPVVQGQIYFVQIRGGSTGPDTDLDAINGYSLVVLNGAPPVPHDLELSRSVSGVAGAPDTGALPANAPGHDTGRSQFDNVTRNATPRIYIRLDDAILRNDLPGNDAGGNPPDRRIDIPFSANTATPGFRVAVFNGNNTHTPVGFASEVAGFPGLYEFTFPAPLANGLHHITAVVQMVDGANPRANGFAGRSSALQLIVDTVPPPVNFGTASNGNNGLDSGSDSGVPYLESTFADRVTNVANPTFYGTAEANAVIRVFVQLDPNTTILIGQTVATPLDGTNAFPDGRWVVQSNVNLNDPTFFPLDGTRTILVYAEDLAGNVSDASEMRIFLDTRGPQVMDVKITAEPIFNLFGLKPDNRNQGPTPLVFGLDLEFVDLPGRDPRFFPNHVALAQQRRDQLGALAPGAYEVSGDLVGIVPIVDVLVSNLSLENGKEARAIVTLVFDPAHPLPDDRYTLTIRDTLTDPAGNQLDGESNASQPLNLPTFPSGDGRLGGDFIARFTVDSRPEVSTWGNGKTYIDLNGNGAWDPQGSGDAVHHDISFNFGRYSDDLFAGNFSGPRNPANGYDKLGAYGKVNGVYRWLLDLNDDGVADVNVVSGLQLNGMPIAGDFNPNLPGDEIGLFTGGLWYFDTNGNNNIDAGDRAISNALRGYPIVGDFDGDGRDDLATYQPDTDTFQFDLAPFGQLNATIAYGFPGVMERPIAADMDQDGVDDIGLFVPRVVNAGEPVSADWYFLISQGTPQPGTVRTLNHAFTPVPFGEDLAYTLFNGFNVPVVGNFDPPIGGTAPSSVFKAAAGTFTDVVVTAQVDAVSVGGTAGLAARRSAGGNSEYWGGLVFNGATYTTEIRKKVAGNWTTLATTPVTFTPGTTLSFEVVGTSLTLSVEGQTVTEASDPSIRDAGGAGSDSSPSSVVWPPTAANVVRPATPLPYSNTFDQANGAPLGNSWNQWQGNFTVVNGKLTGQAARNLATLFADKPRNVTVEATVTALAKNGYAALVARYNEQTGEMYYAQLVNKKGKYFAEIVKVSRGVKTKLSSTRLAAGVTGGRLSFALSGVQLNLTLDGVSVGAAADTGLLGGGGVGLLGSGGATFDNVTVIGGF